MHEPNNQKAKTHASFSLCSEKYIPSLNVTIEEYKHKKTGAQHIHIASNHEENVFLVALRTVPEDSTGVAHILEHTALCGSEKYPVRDPFFMMTRRSLNTFMNAFTSSDWTAYPVASMNKKDFNNLVDVYLDSVFFSRLDKLDFLQEGHRLEFQTPDDPNSPLEFKGVVYNEMKGAMSSVSSQLWHTLTKYLFPASTYHHNSGGEPEHIPDLSYEQLLDFYRVHYHPSNAIFMTFGDISAKEHQEKFETQVLTRFEKLSKEIAVSDEKRYVSPLNIEEYYANNDEDLSEKTHVVMGWLLGKSANLEELLRAQLLSSILLDHSASPLMHALESSELGNAPSPLCGLDDSQKELSFVCGLSGTTIGASQDVENLILETLERVAKEGVSISELEAALHQLELQQREIGGDSYPYGLQLILKSLNAANHRGDPSALLDLDAALEKLRLDIQNPSFIQDLVKTQLLKNDHRVRLTLKPDATINEKKIAAEEKKLEKIKHNLSEKQKQQIIQQSQALKERQDQEDDPAALPKVGLQDVPSSERSVSGQTSKINTTPIHKYSAGTNGLVYQQVLFDLPAFSHQELDVLSLYSHCLTELGAAENDYLEMQMRQNAVCGGISTYASIRGDIEKINQCSGFYSFSSKALVKNHLPMSELQQQYIHSARFDEHARIKEIIAQLRVGMEQSIVGNGHALAMSAAASGCSYAAYLGHEFSGLRAIQSVKQLDEALNTSEGLRTFSGQLENIHKRITDQQAQILLIGEEKELQGLSEGVTKLCTEGKADHRFGNSDFNPQNVNQAWLGNAPVNFCAKAYATVPSAHPDAANLVVLGHYLRNNFLHKTIREQGGAYGGGASQDNNGASFRFYSYRDPRLESTLSDFDASIQWLLKSKHAEDKLEEAILGTIGGIDRSESPAGQAKRCFYSELHGRTQAFRDEYRTRVLNTKIEDLIRVAETYLQPEKANTAVVTSKSNIKQVTDYGLDAIEI